MIADLDIPHNVIGLLALEAQLRTLHRDQTNDNRAMIERSLGLTTTQAFEVLTLGVPEEYVWDRENPNPIPSDGVYRQNLYCTLVQWDRNRPHYTAGKLHRVPDRAS